MSKYLSPLTPQHIKNLKKMAKYIATIPQEQFDMSKYGIEDRNLIGCGTVGCVLGHCIALDKENVITSFSTESSIYHETWAKTFTGITHSDERDFLFHSFWDTIDNTPIGASKRILYFIKHGLPDVLRNKVSFSNRLDTFKSTVKLYQ